MTRSRLARALGLAPDEAELLASRARARLGREAFALRMAAFALATAPVGSRLMPARIRRRAIHPLLYALFPGPTENLLYTVGRRGDEVDADDA